jgi:acyl-CoA thioester hydrolase
MAMAYADYRHRMPMRVRWAEVDMQGVVFNGHYLTYCDVCVTEYWRALGLRYPEDFLQQGADTFVRKAVVEYHAPALFDDELEVCGRTARLGRSSLHFVVEMFRSGAPEGALIGAELVYVNADPASRKSRPWWPEFRERVRAFEVVAPEEARG